MSCLITNPGVLVWNTTAGSKTTAGFTPAVGDLIVVIAASSGLAGGTTAVTDDNSSGTYTQVDSDRTGFSTTGVLTIWVRTALIASAVSTTVTAAQVGSTGGGLVPLRVKGMTLTGASAVRSNGGQSTGTGGTTPTPTLNQLPRALNPIIVACANGDNGTSVTLPGGLPTYSGSLASGYNTPATGLCFGWTDMGERRDAIPFGATSASAYASVAIELECQDVKQPAAFHAGTAFLAEKLRDTWKRRRSGIFVPDLWLPEGARV